MIWNAVQFVSVFIDKLIASCVGYIQLNSGMFVNGELRTVLKEASVLIKCAYLNVCLRN
jgi:hypothetical protein